MSRNNLPQISAHEKTVILEQARASLDIAGDFVEFGCYTGDTSIELGHILRSTDRRLFLYDSFAGLPAKSTQDSSPIGDNFKSGELIATKSDLIIRFKKAGLRLPIIKKAWFSDLTSADLPDQIAFAFLDGDFYESIRDSLKLVAPSMSPNSTIIIHDYNNPALPGVTKAVDEFLLSFQRFAIGHSSHYTETLALLTKIPSKK